MQVVFMISTASRIPILRASLLLNFPKTSLLSFVKPTIPPPTRYLGVRGEAIDNVAKRYGAVVAINAGGFYDPDWNSNGALPHGIVIIYNKFRRTTSIHICSIISSIPLHNIY